MLSLDSRPRQCYSLAATHVTCSYVIYSWLFRAGLIAHSIYFDSSTRSRALLYGSHVRPARNVGRRLLSRGTAAATMILSSDSLKWSAALLFPVIESMVRDRLVLLTY